MTEYECPKCRRRWKSLPGIWNHMTYDCHIPSEKRRMVMGYYKDNEGVRGVLRSSDLVDIPHLEVSKRDLVKLTGRRCQVCGRRDVYRLHLHHIIPKSESGPDTIENLVVLCPNCHGKAHQWREEAKRQRGEPRGLSITQLKRAQQNFV